LTNTKKAETFGLSLF